MPMMGIEMPQMDKSPASPVHAAKPVGLAAAFFPATWSGANPWRVMRHRSQDLRAR